MFKVTKYENMIDPSYLNICGLASSEPDKDVTKLSRSDKSNIVLVEPLE